MNATRRSLLTAFLLAPLARLAHAKPPSSRKLFGGRLPGLKGTPVVSVVGADFDSRWHVGTCDSNIFRPDGSCTTLTRLVIFERVTYEIKAMVNLADFQCFDHVRGILYLKDGAKIFLR